MPEVLTITDESLYDVAANEIAAERAKRGEENLEPDRIGQVIRSYVWLGLHKEIYDWSYALSQAVQDSIIDAVTKHTSYAYRFTPAYGKTYVTLQLLQDLADVGRISPLMAQPRYYQIVYEDGQTSKGFFMNLKDAVKNLPKQAGKMIREGIKGLGIDIPEILLYLGAAGIGIYFLTRRK